MSGLEEGRAFLDRIVKAIRSAESQGLACEPDGLTGYSGNRVVGTLQRLARLFAREVDACYVEIGVFQGLTLLSVASACPELACFGVDNFAYFDPKGENLSILESHKTRLNLENAFLIKADYEDALGALEREIGDRHIGVYFVDGPHDYRSQLMCLELALPYLHRNAVIVVDDANYRHVRQADRDFLVVQPGFKLMFEAYTRCHPGNMTALEQADARLGWWNGVNIIVRDQWNLLEAMYPLTDRSRTLYENEHTTHASNVAEFVPGVLRLVQALDEGSPVRVIKHLVKLAIALRRGKRARRHLSRGLNTYSDGLPAAHYNRVRAANCLEGEER